MKDSVIIKSNKYGLTLVLNKEVSFEKLVKDICYKFADSRDFFGTGEMIISYEGRDISPSEGAVIIEAIELNSDIKIKLLNENNEIKDIEMQKKIDRFYYDNIFENAKIIRGNVTKKTPVVSDSSIVILGDVKSNATVQAAGNVIVFGSMEGEIIAGYPDNNQCYILANELISSKATIGNISGSITIQEKWFSRARRKSGEATAVVVWDNELLAEPITSGLLKRI